MSEDKNEMLENIEYNLSSIAGSLEEIKQSLGCAFLQLSDEEQLALQFCLHAGQTPEAGFRSAHLFLKECDRRRVWPAK